MGAVHMEMTDVELSCGRMDALKLIARLLTLGVPLDETMAIVNAQWPL